jgi:hypothetical protein
VGDQDHLAAVAVSNIAEQGENLPLPENFQVRIRFIDQQHTLLVQEEVGENQQHLLKAPTG